MLSRVDFAFRSVYLNFYDTYIRGKPIDSDFVRILSANSFSVFHGKSLKNCTVKPYGNPG